MNRWLTRIAARWLSRQSRKPKRTITKAIEMARAINRPDLVARLEALK